MMIDLITEIESVIKRNKLTFCEVDHENRDQLFKTLSRTFHLDYNLRWPWTNLWLFKDAESYSDQWQASFESYLPKFEDLIYIAVTNDELYPWPLYYGKQKEVSFLLKELPFFEYFIFDFCMEYILFDTHHNEFILFTKEGNNLKSGNN